MPAPPEFIKFVDNNSSAFIERLRAAVAIPSVSGDPSFRPRVIEMSNWLNGQLQQYGTLPLPPAILGRIGDDKSKKTVLLYGHFDVQPAAKSDGWDTDPFVLVEEKDGRLVGRGSTDDKGPILGWLNVLQWHHETKTPLPVNLLFCFEGMEENGSEGLDELVIKEKDGWFKDADCVCIVSVRSCNAGTSVDRTRATTTGLTLGPGTHVRSAWACLLQAQRHWSWTRSALWCLRTYVHEPMTDLISIMSKLVSPTGEILIPGVDDMVKAADMEERAIYEQLNYSIEDVESGAGGKIALSDDKATVLMGRMRLPSLSLHGLGQVLDPTPDSVEPLVKSYIQSEFDKLGSKNTLEIELLHSGKPWVTDYKHWNFAAAITATEEIYKTKPDLTREGGSIPVTLTFAEALGANVLLLPMGRGDDGAHSTNEKLDKSNFIEGTKLLGTYLYEVGAIKAEGK
ncbi:unnamed protein product [Mycena citricolor]|uniref:Peptidase M20 dimerisation domain-containing protein n=1 Tax=Mycena citricolor TaxID=2018698 RepID=A0AAD2HUR1_9AGAR|nr:unnamed protein product [Mycena citricolor]